MLKATKMLKEKWKYKLIITSPECEGHHKQKDVKVKMKVKINNNVPPECEGHHTQKISNSIKHKMVTTAKQQKSLQR